MYGKIQDSLWAAAATAATEASRAADGLKLGGLPPRALCVCAGSVHVSESWPKASVCA